MKRNLLIIILCSFLLLNLTACNSKNTYPQETNNDKGNEEIIHSKKENNDSNITVKSNKTVENYNDNDKNSNMVENYDTTNKKESENNYTTGKEAIEKIEFSDNDNIVILEFNKLKDKTIEILNSQEVETAKDKVKGVFISIVDFLFYDGKINGIEFSDLTDAGKKEVLSIAGNIDNLIVTKFSNYKKDISSSTSNAYNKASELIIKGSKNLTDFSKEKLGEVNYNAIINAKDDLVNYTKKLAGIVGDFSSTTITKVQEKITNWYEEFRND